MEIRSNQIVDELFRRRFNFTAAIQCFTLNQMDYTLLQEKPSERT